MKVNTWQKKLTEGIYEMSSSADVIISALINEHSFYNIFTS